MRLLTSILTLAIVVNTQVVVAQENNQQVARLKEQVEQQRKSRATQQVQKKATRKAEPKLGTPLGEYALQFSEVIGLALGDVDNDGDTDLFISRQIPLIGITAAPADSVLKAQLRIKSGLVVNAVVQKSPADKAGVRIHDVLVKAGERPLRSLVDLEGQLKKSQQKPVEFHLLRRGTATKLLIKPVVWKSTEFQEQILFVPQNLGRWIGITASPADTTLRKQLRLADGQGLVITQVHETTPAAKSGLQIGDILLTAAGRTVGRIEDLRRTVNDPKAKKVELTFLRAGKRHVLTVVPVRHMSLTPFPKVRDLQLGFQPKYVTEFVLPPTIVTQQQQSLVWQNRLPAARGTQPAKPAGKPSVDDILKQIDQLRRQVEKLKK